MRFPQDAHVSFCGVWLNIVRGERKNWPRSLECSISTKSWKTGKSCSNVLCDVTSCYNEPTRDLLVPYKKLSFQWAQHDYNFHKQLVCVCVCVGDPKNGVQCSNTSITPVIKIYHIHQPLQLFNSLIVTLAHLTSAKKGEVWENVCKLCLPLSSHPLPLECIRWHRRPHDRVLLGACKTNTARAWSRYPILRTFWVTTRTTPCLHSLHFTAKMARLDDEQLAGKIQRICRLPVAGTERPTELTISLIHSFLLRVQRRLFSFRQSRRWQDRRTSTRRRPTSFESESVGCWSSEIDQGRRSQRFEKICFIAAIKTTCQTLAYLVKLAVEIFVLARGHWKEFEAAHMVEPIFLRV